MSLAENDLADLRYAKSLLENPGLAAKISNLLGTTIGKGFELLPVKSYDLILKIAKESLQKALDFALKTMDDRSAPRSSDRTHKILAAATGAGGGAFGISALAVELPISTTIMLRSIADIARSEGEQIRAIEAKLACLEVFALGGRSHRDDGSETGYFFVRTALAKTVSDAAQYITRKGLGEKSAPAIVRLIAAVAARFGVVVSEKAAAQAVPLIGAAGGALINTVFIDHFQNMARGHFIVRRLERTYGSEMVKEAYDKLRV
ncbi:MAG: EcsC family protein [Desulfobacterales bacterium]|nr:MAG: EcsC family protein [Desulfobacterales bacterium]